MRTLAISKSKHTPPDFPDLQEACRRLDERCGSKSLSPLPYAFPAELMVAAVPEKTADFGNGIPIDGNYLYGPGQMSLYYQNYQNSHFSLTTKKGGWEALRHLEICGNGCVPLMPDIGECPPFSMTNTPRHLYLEAWNTWGPRLECKNGNLNTVRAPLIQDEASYQNMAQRILAYTREKQTTLELAKWFLSRNGVDTSATVLFVADSKKICYSTEMLCHGLKKLLGSKLIDAPKSDYLYSSFPASSHQKLYGNGYGYAGLLPEIETHRRNVKARLKRGAFDLVVFAQINRASSLLPTARRFMPPERIAIVDGGDPSPLPGFSGSAKIKRLGRGLQVKDLITAGHFFKREITETTLQQFDHVK